LNKRFSVGNTLTFWAFESIGAILGLLVGGAFDFPLGGLVGACFGAIAYIALDSKYSTPDK